MNSVARSSWQVKPICAHSVCLLSLSMRCNSCLYAGNYQNRWTEEFFSSPDNSFLLRSFMRVLIRTLMQAYYLTSSSSLGAVVSVLYRRPFAGILEFISASARAGHHYSLRHLLHLSLMSLLLPIKTVPVLPGEQWLWFACGKRPQRWQMELLLLAISKHLLHNTHRKFEWCSQAIQETRSDHSWNNYSFLWPPHHFLDQPSEYFTSGLFVENQSRFVAGW